MPRILLLVTLYLTLGGAWAYRLRPQPAVVVDDHQRAPRLQRLTHFLMKAPQETVQPVLMSIAFLDDEHLLRVDQWLSQPSMQQLREITVQDTPMLRNAGSLRDALLLGWLGQESVANTAADAHLMIAAAGARFDDTMLRYSFEILAKRAQADGDLESAMTILERAADVPACPWSIPRAYIQLARERDLPAAALASVTEWLKRYGKNAPAAELEEARELEVFFYLRINRAEDALALQIDRLKLIPAAAPLSDSTLNRALVCARASGQLTHLLPWIERHLTSFTEHQVKAADLLTRPDIDTGYLHWLREYASIADHDLPPARAYEACLRLAAAGELSAYTRLCTLAEESKRIAEAETFLTLALAQPSLRPTLLSLAQQQPLARRLVTEALRKEPKNRDLHFAATLAAAADQPGSSTTHWHSYLRRFPGDIPARRRLVQAHLAARQPDLALRVLHSIAPDSLTDSDRQQLDLLRQL